MMRGCMDSLLTSLMKSDAGVLLNLGFLSMQLPAYVGAKVTSGMRTDPA